MRYHDMLHELFRARRFGTKLGLGRVRRASARLGAPHEHMGAVVHIGGTNGKGTTARMVAQGAEDLGLRTGLFTSPHLSRFSERYLVNGKEVSSGTLLENYKQLRDVAHQESLTFFEQATLLAFLVFSQEKVELSVIEVGLGGRLDSTNVVSPIATAVVHVGLDHQAVLGQTVEKIALEKAGIFKQSVPAVIGSSNQDLVFQVLETEAHRVGASVTRSSTLAREYLPNVPGWFLRNAGVAGALLRIVANKFDLSLSDHDLTNSFGKAKVPGRFEVICWRGKRVVFDVGHNVDAASEIVREWRRRKYPQAHCIFGCSLDKDANAIASILSSIVGRWSLPEFQHDRLAKPVELKRRLSDLNAPVVCLPTLSDAFACKDGPDLVLVAGSVFVVGQVRSFVLGDKMDPLVVQDPSASQTLL